MRQIVALANHASEQARAIARGMDPVVLKEGFPAALQDLAASTREAFTVSCLFSRDPAAGLPGKFAASHLYRIAQEAIHNAVRHGQPRHIRIQLCRQADASWLAVSDDGTGPPEGRHADPGMGIRNMQYRARLIGSRLELFRNDRGGTTVRCTFASRRAEERRAP